MESYLCTFTGRPLVNISDYPAMVNNPAAHGARLLRFGNYAAADAKYNPDAAEDRKAWINANNRALRAAGLNSDGSPREPGKPRSPAPSKPAPAAATPTVSEPARKPYAHPLAGCEDWTEIDNATASLLVKLGVASAVEWGALSVTVYTIKGEAGVTIAYSRTVKPAPVDVKPEPTAAAPAPATVNRSPVGRKPTAADIDRAIEARGK